MMQEKRRRPRRMMDDDDGEGKAQEKVDAPKKTSQGWGSPSSKTDDGPVTHSKLADDPDEDEQTKGRRRNLRDVHDETEMVMMIPDLEEDESEDITLQVAAAPRNIARRLPSLEQV